MSSAHSPRSSVFGPQSPVFGERGIALVITLIMLSVITFMAITFLVLSHRERGAVTTSTDQMTANYAVDSATERAEAELIARVVGLNNDQDFGLMVSTNFINELGYDPAAPSTVWGFNPTNVNYSHLTANFGGGPVAGNNALQNMANLLYDPRPPVFVTTNRNTGGKEFRFYLDLNRNGRFDTNGLQPVISPDPLDPYYRLDGTLMPLPAAGETLSNFFVGDPEWVGVLQHPEWPHSPSNRFVGRWAFLVEPTGKGLDINYIYNQVLNPLVGPEATLGTEDGFFRNQGVAPWEINLAAFLADLNTNAWNTVIGPYDYREPALFNRGVAFDDARALLAYRYNYRVNNLATLTNASSQFANGADVFRTDGIDEYSDGPLVGLNLGIDESVKANQDDPTRSWVGSYNPNHYFTPQEFYDPNKVQRPRGRNTLGFVDRLQRLGTGNASYDRYTFYRMLEQLGTGSTPEVNKLNLNYRNVDNRGNVVPGMQTNLIAWTADGFFTNAANRLLLDATHDWLNSPYTLGPEIINGLVVNSTRAAYAATFGVTNSFGVTNIPVFVTYNSVSNGLVVSNNIFGYTPAIHRLLQQVANIYDAITNQVALPNTGTNIVYAPTVFRPIFRRNADSSEVFIVGYREVANDTTTLLPRLMAHDKVLGTLRMVDLQYRTTSPYGDPGRDSIPVLGTKIGNNESEPMVYGIPLIIGAKKGFPNFNKFALQNDITVTRKLHFHRAPGQSVSLTNQLYSFGISNVFGAQLWNSYGIPFSRPVRIYVSADVTLAVRNQLGQAVTGPEPASQSLDYNYPTDVQLDMNNSWPAYFPQATASFIVPLLTNIYFLPNSSYTQTGTGGTSRFHRDALWDPNNTFYVPHLWLNLRTRVRVALYDTGEHRLLDYVNLDSSEAPLNLIDAARHENVSDFPRSGADPDPGSFWETNRLGNPSGTATGPNSPAIPTYGILQQYLVSLGLPTVVSDSFWRKFNSTVNDKEKSIAEFTHRITFNGTNANDLNFFAPFSPTRTFHEFQDWEANDPLVHYTIPDLTDLLGAAKEKIQWDADNKTPVRRLGANNPLSDHYRPWGGNPSNPTETSVPTRYNTGVKDPLIRRSDDWAFPMGKFANIGWLGQVHRGSPWQTIYLKSIDDTNSWQRWSGDTNLFDALMSRPASDRLLFDVFSTALNDDATRGRLSVNQNNLAAWSAVLSGVSVITNSDNGQVGTAIIEPAGIYDPFDQADLPPVARIVQGINATRANVIFPTNNVFLFPNKEFQHVGDVLATPQLTDASPFVNTAALPTPNAGGVNDQVLERIPQQIMSLLTLSSSPEFLIYAYGQTLHPAPGSLVNSGPYMGLCTNYQVTAETASRTLVRLEGSINPQDATNTVPSEHYPPRLVVEQYNVLPPE